MGKEGKRRNLLRERCRGKKETTRVKKKSKNKLGFAMPRRGRSGELEDDKERREL